MDATGAAAELAIWRHRRRRRPDLVRGLHILPTPERQQLWRNVSTQCFGGGESASVAFTRDDVPLYKPSELSTRLGLLPDGSGSILLLYTAGVAYELFWPVFDMPVKRAAHVPAMWTRGLSKAIVPDAPDGPDAPDKRAKSPVVAAAPGSPISGGAVPSGSRSQPEPEPEPESMMELAPIDVGPFPLQGGVKATCQAASLDARHAAECQPCTEAARPMRKPRK